MRAGRAPGDRRRRDAARRSGWRSCSLPRDRRLIGIRPSDDDRRCDHDFRDADGRRRGARLHAARRHRHDAPAGRRARPLGRPLLLSQGRHARLHDRGVRVPRRQRRLSARATPRSGASACSAAAARPRSRPSSGCPSRSSPTRTTRSPRRTATWVEKKNYGKTYMGIKRATFLVDPDGRIAAGLAEGEARGPRRRGPRGARRSAAGPSGPTAPRRADTRRHRSWGETSDASARSIHVVRHATR